MAVAIKEEKVVVVEVLESFFEMNKMTVVGGVVGVGVVLE